MFERQTYPNKGRPAPRSRAWIETVEQMKALDKAAGRPAPRSRAWIETASSTPLALPRPVARLLGAGRGLKLAWTIDLLGKMVSPGSSEPGVD